MRRILWAALALGACLASPAAAIENGETMFSITYGGGQADWVQPSGTTGYITSQAQLPAILVGGELWHAMSDHGALAIAAGLSYFHETDKPGTGALPTAEEQKSTATAFRIRVGHDMYANVNEQFTVYGGGGLVFSSGKFKYESGTVSDESPTVSTYGLDGRIGLMMRMGSSVSMGGRIGNTFGLSSAEQDGAKSSWTTKHAYGEGLIAFHFGGR